MAANESQNLTRTDGFLPLATTELADENFEIIARQELQALNNNGMNFHA